MTTTFDELDLCDDCLLEGREVYGEYYHYFNCGDFCCEDEFYTCEEHRKDPERYVVRKLET